MASRKLILSPHDAAGSAARRAIAFHLGSLRANARGAKAGGVEAIHQLRVATRRIRAALRLFGGCLSPLNSEAAGAELKWLAGAAGAIRNLDVIGRLMRGRARTLGSGRARNLATLWKDLRAKRAEERKKLAAAIESKRCRELFARLGPPLPVAPAGDEPLESRARKLARPIVRSMMRAGARIGANPTPRKLHRLRICAKRARYAIEMMRPGGGKRLARILAEFEAMQDGLGSCHDAAVAVTWIEDWAKERPRPAATILAAGALAESLRQWENKRRRKAINEWKKFGRKHPKNDLLDALGR